jgi:hypothetical protein
MSQHTLIMCDHVNGLDFFLADGPDGWIWSATVKSRSLYPFSTFENLSPNQYVDASKSRFGSMGIFRQDQYSDHWSDDSINRGKKSSKTTITSLGWGVVRREVSGLVPGMRGMGNSGALSLEPFEMSGLNFQVSTRCWDTGSIGARKIE